MKNILSILLILVLSFGLAVGCSTTETVPPVSDEQDVSQNTSTIKAGVFYYNFLDIYISSVRSSLNDKLEADGIEYENFDAASTQATQTEQINQAIAAGTNLLIVNLVDNASDQVAQSVVDIAKAADVPIIFFNREISSEIVNSYDKCIFVGTNSPEAGQMQGDMIGDFLLENYSEVDLNGDGVISYVLFKGQEGNPEADLRTQFSVENANAKLEASGYPSLMFFEQENEDSYYVDQNGDWSAQAANDYMNTFLSQYSEDFGNMIELVIANNDDMAEGAISALNTVGYNTGEQDSNIIPVFGVDATETAQQLIANGKMTGTIKQDSIAMAESIAIFARNVQTGADLMANTEELIIDSDAAMIRVPYSFYTG